MDDVMIQSDLSPAAASLWKSCASECVRGYFSTVVVHPDSEKGQICEYCETIVCLEVV